MVATTSLEIRYADYHWNIQVVDGTAAMRGKKEHTKEHPKEVDTEMEQMLMYDDEEPEDDAQQYFAESENEEEGSDETEQGENWLMLHIIGWQRAAANCFLPCYLASSPASESHPPAGAWVISKRGI